jgi:drug/metabolite transporter (DMT)-like permease
MESLLGISMAILSMFSSGTHSFLHKQFSHKKDSNLYILFEYLIYFFIGTISWFFFGNSNFQFEFIILVFLNSIFYTISVIFKIKSLKKISTTEFFLTYKIFSTMSIVTIAWVFFNETLTNFQLFGFFIGFFVFILLFEKPKPSLNKINNKNNINKKKFGYAFLFISIFFGVFANIANINIKYMDFNFFNFLLLDGISGFLFVILINFKNGDFKKKKNHLFENLKIIVFSGFLKYLAVIFYIFTFTLIPFGIATKINSFSILVPIFLSAILLNEKITKKQIIAIILSMVSIYFFI